MRRDITPEAEADRLAGLRDRHGYDAFKFRIGSECGHDRDEWPGRTEAIVPAVRKALGDDAALLVDANSCYTPAKAIEVGRMLEDHGVCHFEEPCPYWELEWTRQVADALDVAVTGGEQDCELPTWRRMIGMRAVDVVQPDVCYLGGLTRTLRVVAMAQAAGLPVTPHSANLSLVTVFTLHMMGAIAGAGPYVEFSIEGADYYPWQDGHLRAGPGGPATAGSRSRTGRDGGSRSSRHGWSARPIRRASSTDDAPAAPAPAIPRERVLFLPQCCRQGGECRAECLARTKREDCNDGPTTRRSRIRRHRGTGCWARRRSPSVALELRAMPAHRMRPPRPAPTTSAAWTS